MMKQDKWQERLLSVISEIADSEYQKTVWLHGGGSEVSSWEEAVCRFFDDYDAEGFVEEYFGTNTYDREKEAAFTRFMDALSDFSRRVEDNPEPKRILDDPGWIDIQNLARSVLASWSPQPS